MKKLYAKLKLTNSFPYKDSNTNYEIDSEDFIVCDSARGYRVLAPFNIEDFLYLDRLFDNRDGINIYKSYLIKYQSGKVKSIWHIDEAEYSHTYFDEEFFYVRVPICFRLYVFDKETLALLGVLRADSDRYCIKTESGLNLKLKGY